MASQLVEIQVDNKDVMRCMTAYSRDQKNIMKKAYRKGAQPIVKLAKRLMKSAFRQLKFTYRKEVHDLRKGIRTSIYKDGSAMSIYERSPFDKYFILLFHDLGAINGRRKRKAPSKYYKYHAKGGIQAKGFFQSALKQEPQATNTIIDELRKSIADKFNHK